MKKVSTNQGFTFIEILLVMMLILILFTGTMWDILRYLWVIEIPISIAWFVVQFMAVRNTYKTFLMDYAIPSVVKSILLLCFITQVIYAYMMRYYYFSDMLNSYLYPFLLLSCLPAFITIPLVIYYSEKKPSIRLSPERMKEIALQDPQAKTFVESNPGYSLYISQNTTDFRMGSCLFAARRKRDELENLYEECTLTIFIDLKKKAIVNDLSDESHYFFIDDNDQSTLVELHESDKNFMNLNNPIDTDILSQLQNLPPRFPSLQQGPLPLLSNKINYQKIIEEVGG
jgi:prepilin-type N-terminal cleavage/methylation domain-containing protein